MSLNMDIEAEFPRRPRGNRANTRDFKLGVMKNRLREHSFAQFFITCQPLHKITHSRRTSKCYYVKLFMLQEREHCLTLFIIASSRKCIVGDDFIYESSCLLKVGHQYFAGLSGTREQNAFSP